MRPFVFWRFGAGCTASQGTATVDASSDAGTADRIFFHGCALQHTATTRASARFNGVGRDEPLPVVGCNKLTHRGAEQVVEVVRNHEGETR
jgi:hypothetical protein